MPRQWLQNAMGGISVLLGRFPRVDNQRKQQRKGATETRISASVGFELLGATLEGFYTKSYGPKRRLQHKSECNTNVLFENARLQRLNCNWAVLFGYPVILLCPQFQTLAMKDQQVIAMHREEPFFEGVNLFNTGKYFEAHEVWEDLWRSMDEGPLKSFYQGLIQAAVALHHLNRGNTTGARSQLTKSIEKLARCRGEVSSIDAEDLLAQLKRVRDEMRPEKVQIRALKLW